MRDDATQTATEAPGSLILRVRAPVRPFVVASSSSSSGLPPHVLQMRVSLDTTPQALSDGIRHALQLERADSSIPGLFDEESGVYYFLNDVLSQSRHPGNPQRTYSLYAPSLPPPPRLHDDGRKLRVRRFLERAIGQVREGVRTRPGAAILALVLVALGVSVARSALHPLAWFLALSSTGTGWVHTRQRLQSALYEAHDRAIVHPLRDMYRNGPWIIGGWEGDRLERVCSRITYHGDESFWSRNLAECERIYSAKEAAWLRVTRPLANVVVLVALFSIGRRVLRRPIPRRLSPTERDALETYRAIQVLTRQLKKNT
jgi:hypothetical protein